MAYRIISADKFRSIVSKHRGGVSFRAYASTIGVSAQYQQSVESGRRPASPLFASLFRVDDCVCVPVTAYELVPIKDWKKENGPLWESMTEKPKPKPKPARASTPKKKRKRKPAAPKKQLEMVIPLEPLTADQKKANRNGHKRSDAERSILTAKVHELRNEGVSLAEIAKRVGVPKTSVIGWLKKAS